MHDRRSDMTVNILGRDYAIEHRTDQEDEKLKHCSGYCDYSAAKIVVEKPTERDVMRMTDQEMLTRKVLRHELIHAFAAESGLTDDSDWAIVTAGVTSRSTFVLPATSLPSSMPT